MASCKELKRSCNFLGMSKSLSLFIIIVFSCLIRFMHLEEDTGAIKRHSEERPLFYIILSTCVLVPLLCTITVTTTFAITSIRLIFSPKPSC